MEVSYTIFSCERETAPVKQEFNMNLYIHINELKICGYCLKSYLDYSSQKETVSGFTV